MNKKEALRGFLFIHKLMNGERGHMGAQTAGRWVQSEQLVMVGANTRTNFPAAQLEGGKEREANSAAGRATRGTVSAIRQYSHAALSAALYAAQYTF